MKLIDKLKKNKKKSFALAIVLMMLLIYTVNSVNTEPSILTVRHGSLIRYPFSTIALHQIGKPGFEFKNYYYNISMNGNNMEAEAFLRQWQCGEYVNNLSSMETDWHDAFTYSIGIINETLAFPYTAETLSLQSVQFGINSSKILNTSNKNTFEGMTLKQALVLCASGIVFYPNGTHNYGYSITGSIIPRFGPLELVCNETCLYNPGNYTFYFNETFVPTVFIGPYHYSGGPVTMRYVWTSDLIKG